MLRPKYLLDARGLYAAGKTPDAEFKKIEDRAVDECLAIQERAGVDVVTDGEMRRDHFASQLFQSTEGFKSIKENIVDWYDKDERLVKDKASVGLAGTMKRKRHLSTEEFAYMRGKTKKPIKATLPSPTMYAYYWVPGISEAAYPSPKEYLADACNILRDEVGELVRLGATYIQFDAPELGMLTDPHQREWFASKGFDPDQMVRDGADMINQVIEGYKDVTFGLHICRGNDRSRHMAKGSYASIAREAFRANVQRLLLEYDDERSGDFEPLKDVPDDKTVVLGLITTKWPREETIKELTERIHEASRYVPLERLALSTQCGFASAAAGNAIPFEIQEQKLKLVTEVARRVWDD
ncbi:MAG: cobalamin-independent methionine synthase II family protein [bacterium]|nr:cobalamin-independent methionine synthase II family protein [bacterium]